MQREDKGYTKIASYNVKCMVYGSQWEEIKAVVKEIDPDIIGFQEIDYKAERSNFEDQMKRLSEELGYPYWHFCCSLKRGERGYGHGVLSRYPIKESEAVNYEVCGARDSDGNRTYSRHVIDFNGRTLCFYNTHLTLGTDDEVGAEMKQVLAAMAKDEYAVLTGDMNKSPSQLLPYVDTKRFTMLNGGDTCACEINTFPQGNEPTRPIDNIIVSKSLCHFWDEATDAGIIVHHADCSDHNLIYTYIMF